MAAKNTSPFIVGLALLVIGIIMLLATLGILIIPASWYWAIILIIVGLWVILYIKKGIVNILGWICLIYGVILLLMAFGLFYVAFLWNLYPVVFILFALMLLL